MIHWFNALLLGMALYWSIIFMGKIIKTLLGKHQYWTFSDFLMIFSWMFLVAFWGCL